MLYNEDCRETLQRKEFGPVDLVVTSPPYDDLRTYGGIVWNWGVFSEVVVRLWRKLSPGGVVVWVVNDATCDGSETCTSFRQALHFRDIGFRLHDTMIWRKPNFSNPSRLRYHQVFEYMFVFSKGAPKTFNPLMDRKNVCGGKPGSLGKNTCTQMDGSKLVRARKVVPEWGMRHNVWDMLTSGQERMCQKIAHPATFPLALARDHIQSWSNEGDLVYDPFLGSGTTAVAAKELKRRYAGSEVVPEYFEIAEARLGPNNA